MIETRVLTTEDWQLWRELRRAALTQDPEAFAASLSDWSGAGDTEQRWRERLESVALNLVLTDNGDPVGMVSATAPDSEDAVELLSLWIVPRARGLGVGDEAIRQVLTWVQRVHPRASVVLAVKTANDHAQMLYRRHGFVDAGPAPCDAEERLMRCWPG